MGALDFGVIHYCPQVLDSFVNAGNMTATIGSAGSALVEVKKPGEGGKTLQHATNLGSFPGHLDVLCGRRDRNDRGRAIAEDLIRETCPAGGREVDWGNWMLGRHGAFRLGWTGS
jgi:hypothetical protein